jgi:phosphotransferase system HPr-like phosphotransfer protein
MNRYDEIPKFENGGNNIMIRNVCIKLENGIDDMNAYLLAEETNKFPNHIYLGKSANNKYELFSAKELTSLKTLNAKKGSLVDIVVETRNPSNLKIKNNNVEEISKMIYKGLITENSRPIFKISKIEGKELK